MEDLATPGCDTQGRVELTEDRVTCNTDQWLRSAGQHRTGNVEGAVQGQIITAVRSIMLVVQSRTLALFTCDQQRTRSKEPV